MKALHLVMYFAVGALTAGAGSYSYFYGQRLAERTVGPALTGSETAAPHTSAEMPSKIAASTPQVLHVVPDARPRPTPVVTLDAQKVLPNAPSNLTDWRNYQPDVLTLAPISNMPISFTKEFFQSDGIRGIWKGKANVDDASLVAVATKDTWTGLVTFAHGNEYQIQIAGGQTTVRELNPDLEACGTDLAPTKVLESAKAEVKSIAMPDTAGVYSIDVVFFYDEDTLKLAKSEEQIDSWIRTQIEAANADLDRSGVKNAKWNYLGVYKAPAYDYRGDLSMSTDLKTISESTNPTGKFVHDTMEDLGADRAVLFVGTDRNYAGLAWTPGEECVVLWGMTHMTLAHEMGHNLGCSHDRQTDGAKEGDGKYAYGYRWKGPQWDDTGCIMSYAGVRVPYFSTPELTVDGIQIGLPATDPKAADCVRNIREYAVTAASIRTPQSLPQITSQPVRQSLKFGQMISLSVTATGGHLSYQWYREKEPIPGATSSSYTKSSAVTGDAGNYTVTVKNKVGSAQSDSATVSVEPQTPVGGDSNGGNSSGGSSSGSSGGGAPSTLYFLGLAVLFGVRRVFATRNRRVVQLEN